MVSTSPWHARIGLRTRPASCSCRCPEARPVNYSASITLKHCFGRQRAGGRPTAAPSSFESAHRFAVGTVADPGHRRPASQARYRPGCLESGNWHVKLRDAAGPAGRLGLQPVARRNQNRVRGRKGRIRGLGPGEFPATAGASQPGREEVARCLAMTYDHVGDSPYERLRQRRSRRAVNKGSDRTARSSAAKATARRNDFAPYLAAIIAFAAAVESSSRSPGSSRARTRRCCS